MPRIAVIGSMNADLTVRTPRLPRPGETVAGSDLATLPGGKSSNQAAAAARLGGEVALLARIGDDAHGVHLRQEAEAAGVDTRWVRACPGVPTGVALITVDAAGENVIVLSPGANGSLATRDVATDVAVLDGASVLCLCLEVDHDAVLAAARAGAERGVRVVLNLSPYAEVDPALLAATDVLLVNEHELAGLVGEVAVADAADALAQRGIARAVVTQGARGAAVLVGGEVTQVPSPRVDAVDTTGCGDAFTGALAVRLDAGDDLVAAARFAARAAAYAATREGAQASYATAEELARFTWNGEGPGPHGPGPSAGGDGGI